MAYDLEEQEQLARFKAWRHKYGNLVLTALTAALLAVAAYNGWRWYERDQAGRAATVYDQLLRAVQVQDGAQVKELAGRLTDQYGRSVYASMAALYAARIDHDAGDLRAARARLQWVIEESSHLEYVPIARLRLAGVQLDEKAYDDALRSLSVEVPQAQAAAFADRRGDVLIAQGKVEEARAAYQEALVKADAAHPLRRLIEFKLDAFASGVLMPMRVAMLRIGAVALSTVAVLAACSSSKDPSLKPAELVEIKASVGSRVAWRQSVGSARGAFLQPAVLENAVYAASGSGSLLRVEPESGNLVWRLDTHSSISAGVGSDGNLVAVGTRRGEVLVYDAEGQLRWKAQVASDVSAPPLVGRGLVIVRATDQRVTAFDATDGTRRWTYTRNQPPLTLRNVSLMTFEGDNILVGFPGGRLVALAPNNGAARWEAVIAEPRGATEVERLADVVGLLGQGPRLVCAAAFQGRVTCVDPANGNLRWSREWTAAAGVAIAEGQLYSVDSRSQVGAFAPDTGASVWRNDKLTNRGLSNPGALRGVVAVGDYKGYLHLLAPNDGALIGRQQVDSSAIVAAPRIWADSFIVLTQDGTLARIVLER